MRKNYSMKKYPIYIEKDVTEFIQALPDPLPITTKMFEVADKIEKQFTNCGIASASADKFQSDSFDRIDISVSTKEDATFSIIIAAMAGKNSLYTYRLSLRRHWELDE